MRKEQEGGIKIEEVRREQRRTIIRFLVRLTLFCLILWITFTFVFALYRVRGEDMYPRVRDGDLALCYRGERSYAAEDVVAYRVEGRRYLGRVVAMGGDVVELDSGGKLRVNGSVRSEEIFYLTKPRGELKYPYFVPKDCYFLLGDFRTEAADSRLFGAIRKKDIDGRIIGIFRRRGI